MTTQPTGGTPPRRPDQSYTPPPPAVSPSSGDVIRARTVIVSGTAADDGVFVYNPVPGPNNLVASISAGNGTDDYGNQVLAGQTSYFEIAGTWYASSMVGASFVLLTGGAAQSDPYNDSGSEYAQNTQTGFGQIGSGDAISNVFSLTSGWLAGTDSNGTVYLPGYSMMPDGNVSITGCLTTPATGTVTGVAWAVIPAAYRPGSGANIPTGTCAQATGAHVGTVEIHPNGNMELQGSFGNGENIRLDCIVQITAVVI